MFQMKLKIPFEVRRNDWETTQLKRTMEQESSGTNDLTSRGINI